MGCIPNSSTSLSTSKFRAGMVAWEAFEKPPVCAYREFRDYIESQSSLIQAQCEKSCYWAHTIANYFGFPMWKSNQGNLGSCTSFAVKNASHALMLIQKAKHASLRFEEINPFHTFVLSKNGSTSGGQSLSGIANAYNDFGAFAISDVGEYNDRESGRVKISNEAYDNAEKRQIGFTEVTDNYDFVEEIIFLSKNRVPCIVGNYNLIGDSTIDSNGVRCGVITGNGSHATAFMGGYRKKNGREYVLYAQSWGNTFKGGDDETLPGFMTWVSTSVLKQFVRSSFFDLFPLTYVEGFPENAGFGVNQIEYPGGLKYEE